MILTLRVEAAGAALRRISLATLRHSSNFCNQRVGKPCAEIGRREAAKAAAGAAGIGIVPS
jgi:hypothetical protein